MSRRGVYAKIDRERVRRLMAQGLIPWQIAERLGTSEQNASRIVREIRSAEEAKQSYGGKAVAQLGHTRLPKEKS